MQKSSVTYDFRNIAYCEFISFILWEDTMSGANGAISQIKGAGRLRAEGAQKHADNQTTGYLQVHQEH